MDAGSTDADMKAVDMAAADTDTEATGLRGVVRARASTAAAVDSVVAAPMAEAVDSMAADRTVEAASMVAADMVADRTAVDADNANPSRVNNGWQR